VLSEGLLIAGIGIAAGAAGGFVLARLAASLFGEVQLPGAAPAAGAAVVIAAAAAFASLVPAARAARVDVVQALRSE
jgi:ABC-type antimicrobial peptide transport system permease subunit